MRAIIHDNLTDSIITTKKVGTKETAKKEAFKLIERLCKKFGIEVTDGRFEIQCFEYEK